MTSDDARVVLEVECVLCGQPRALVSLRNLTRVCGRCREAHRRGYDRDVVLALLSAGHSKTKVSRLTGCSISTVKRLRRGMQ